MFAIRAEATWHEGEACVRIEFAGTHVHVPLRTFLDIRDWFVCRGDDFTEFFRRAGPKGPGEVPEIPKGMNGPAAPSCACPAMGTVGVVDAAHGGGLGFVKLHWETCRFYRKPYTPPTLTKLDESDPRVQVMLRSGS
jgi:hypothetical protein